MAAPLITKSQMVDELAEATGFPKGEIRHVLEALDQSIEKHVGNCERVSIGNYVRIGVRIKAATKKRMGRNPSNGEPVEIAAKPASVVAQVKVLKGLKEALPTVQKARKRLGVTAAEAAAERESKNGKGKKTAKSNSKAEKTSSKKTATKSTKVAKNSKVTKKAKKKGKK